MYNAWQAAHEHAFINLNFKPYGHMDPNDCEGSVPGENCEQGVQGENVNMIPLTSVNPNSIKIQIPVAHPHCVPMRGSQTVENVGDKAAKPTLVSGRSNSLEVAAHSATDARHDVGEPTLAGGCPSLLGVPVCLANNEVDLELASSCPNPLEVAVCSAMDTRDNVGWLTLADSCLRLLEAVACAATGAGENVGGPTLADSCLRLLEALGHSVTGMGENASGLALADGCLGLLEALVHSVMGTGENTSGPALADGCLKLLEALAHSVMGTGGNPGGLTLANGHLRLLEALVCSATSTGENASGPTLASGCGGSLQVAVHLDGWRDNVGQPTLAGSCLGSLEGVACLATGAGENICGLTLSGSCPSPRTHIPTQDEGVHVAEPRALAGTLKLTICIPAHSMICDPGPVTEDKSDTDEETTIG